MISTMDEYVAALGRGQSLPFQASSVTTVGHGVSSLWRASGVPGPGAIPPPIADGGEMCDAETAGALPLLDPPGGASLQLARIAASSSAIGMLTLYDRIWHGAVDLSTTNVQPIDWSSVGQRHGDGAGVELWAEITAALASTTAATWTAEVIDQDGSLVEAVALYGSSSAAHRMIPFEAAGGPGGVQAVESIQLSATQASGTLSLVLARRIAEIPIVVAGLPAESAGVELGLPVIEPGACLALMVRHGSSAQSGQILGRLQVIHG